MAKFIVRRIFLLLLTMILVSLAVFLITESSPGNVARNVLGAFVTPEQEASFLAQVGLDKPVYVRYFYWLFGSDWSASRRVGMPLQRITTEDVKLKLTEVNYRLKPLDIVLVRTGADAFWGRPEYLVKGAGMTRESTLFLLKQGIKVVGIDAWSWDRPLPFQAKEFQETGDASLIWEAHFAGIERGFCHMEKLANLDQIPTPHGFKVACFPVKIKGASAGWTRPVAIIDD